VYKNEIYNFFNKKYTIKNFTLYIAKIFLKNMKSRIMKLKITIPIFLLVFSFSFHSIAQNLIKGNVTNANGEALIGASVVIKSTNQGVISDIDGGYALKAKPDDVLVFTYIGFQPKEIMVGNQLVIDVMLTEGVQLEELVITGLGLKREKKALGYAVDELKSDDIANSGKNDIVGSLQGRVAGINIQSSSGAPGAGSSIIIRGITSLDPSRSNRPLYVIDGIEVSDNVDISPTKPLGSDFSLLSNNATQGSVSNRMMDINPEDVESISVLKGAAATALYGVRAANGVVVINTKRGTSGKPVINLNFGYGFMDVNRVPEVQNVYTNGKFGTTQLRTTEWETWGPIIADKSVFATNTYSDFYQRGNNNSYGASISSGNDKIAYRISGNVANSDGIVPYTYYDKTTFSANTDVKMTKKFNVSTNFIYSNIDGNTPPEGRKSIPNVLAYIPNYSDMTQYKEPYTYGTNFSGGNIDHPLFLAQYNTNISNVNRYIGNIGFGYKFFEGLALNYKFGFDAYNDVRNRIVHPETDEGQSGVTAAPYGFAVSSRINNVGMTSNLSLSWAKSLTDKIGMSGNVGHYGFGYNNDLISVIGKRFQIIDFYNLNNAIDLEQSNSFTRYRNLAVYADVTFDYSKYFYLTLTGRNDWTSTLPVENRSYFFPSANMSLIVNEMLNLPEIISFLKLRASYSKIGKDANPYVIGNYFNKKFTNSFNEIIGYGISTYYGDPNLKPEFTTSKEIGFELKLLNNRIGIDFAYFDNFLKDMILPVPLSNGTGFSTYVTNAGAMRNKGIEAVLNLGIIRNKNISWDFSVNYSKYKGKIEEINTGVNEIAIKSLYIDYKYVLGEYVGDLYGYKFESTENDELIIGANGFPTLDKTKTVKLGNALPDFLMNFNNSLTIKGFNLSFLWEWKSGGDAYDITKTYNVRNGQSIETLDRYKQVIFRGVVKNADGTFTPNTKAVELVPNDWYRNANQYRDLAEAYLQDASWVRLRSVSLSYNLPKSILKKTFINAVKLSAIGTNLFLNTPFTGWDPESNYFGADSNVYGYVGLRIPAVKSYNFKIDFTF
jgi:TonB-linked SusC/RagA family outer membrane protein